MHDYTVSLLTRHQREDAARKAERAMWVREALAARPPRRLPTLAMRLSALRTVFPFPFLRKPATPHVQLAITTHQTAACGCTD